MTDGSDTMKDEHDDTGSVPRGNGVVVVLGRHFGAIRRLRPAAAADSIPRMPRSLLLLLATGLAGCTTLESREDCLITSTPPGAHIWLAAVDTGLTTPARLEIGNAFGGDETITLTKKGYRPEVRRLYQQTEGYTSKWIDGVDKDAVSFPLPLYWTFGDFVFPFGVRAALVPGELHVRLYREDEPKLGFEVLAEQAKRRDGAQ